ncbi:7346_t:CDS:2 [Diversispora eburnea]|uniref:7346_t:CDS:1 n=1 Tax=Diversispora eburnea TaxID=1213867 RepID=A0A9N8V0P5_9GLOM|nr:7346_t:CDS:2 [Diversispora eburnea]
MHLTRCLQNLGVANGSFAKFNLLKTRKADISEVIKKIKLIYLVLTPPPFDCKRQEYLYNSICPFAKDEYILDSDQENNESLSFDQKGKWLISRHKKTSDNGYNDF